MIATLTALTALAGLTGNAIEINVNAKEGDVLSGDVKFRATVLADRPITQVEFYVGEELRDADTSTPYEFKLDTLAEKEGPIRVTFAAYTSENESARKGLNLRIDNGISKGAEFHVQHANELLTESKWDEAMQAARVALKAKSGFNPARLAMARAYLGKGVLDLAQKYAEDALASDAGYIEASELLTSINLQKAFNTFHRGQGNQADTLATIRDALKSAVEIRKKNLTGVLDAMGTPTSGENLLRYADLAIRVHRYSSAVMALSPAFRSDNTNPAIVNRLAYAQIRMGRYADATSTFGESIRRSKLDAYGYALLALMELHKGNETSSDNYLSEAFLNDSENLGVRSAQAFVALNRGKLDVLSKVARELAQDNSARTEVQYYLANLYNSLGQYADARKAFERSVLAEPLNYDMFVARGVESLSLVFGGRLESSQNAYQLDVARMFFDTALVAKPESAEALTGLAIIAMQQKKTADALRYSQAAAAALPAYAAGHFTLAMALSQTEAELRAQAETIRRSSKDGNLTPEQQADIGRLLATANQSGKDAQAENLMAGKLDTVRLEGRDIAKLDLAYAYFSRWGRLPLITPPK